MVGQLMPTARKPALSFSHAEHHQAAEAEYPPFVFDDADGNVYELPHPMMLDGAAQLTLTEAEASGQPGAMEEALEQLFPEQWAAIQSMSIAVQRSLMEAWQADVEAAAEEIETSGKGPSPSSAPNRAARRSRKTSPPKAKTSTGSRSGGSKPTRKRS